MIKLNIEKVGTLVGGMFVFTVGPNEKTAQLNGISVGAEIVAQDGFCVGLGLGLTVGLGLGLPLGLTVGLGLGLPLGL